MSLGRFRAQSEGAKLGVGILMIWFAVPLSSSSPVFVYSMLFVYVDLQRLRGGGGGGGVVGVGLEIDEIVRFFLSFLDS